MRNPGILRQDRQFLFSRDLFQVVKQPNRPSTAVLPSKLTEQILGGTGKNRMNMIARYMIFSDSSSFSLADLSALILDFLFRLCLPCSNPVLGAKHDMVPVKIAVIMNCL